MPFRFDPATHTYTDATGRPVRYITGMLKDAGLVDDRWFTEESSRRGQEIHQLTADWDLDALDLASCPSPYRNYVLAYVSAMKILRPIWKHIEQPRIHDSLDFCGTPDRDGVIDGAVAVLEIKSAVDADAHLVQTALQAILIAPEYRLAPEMIRRYAIRLRPNGKYTLVEHINKHDFARAYDVLAKTVGRAA